MNTPMSLTAQTCTPVNGVAYSCFGFIDGTVRPIARPTQNQREVFSGHERCQAIKFQAVTLPNGLMDIYMVLCVADATIQRYWPRMDFSRGYNNQQKISASMATRYTH